MRKLDPSINFEIKIVDYFHFFRLDRLNKYYKEYSSSTDY